MVLRWPVLIYLDCLELFVVEVASRVQPLLIDCKFFLEYESWSQVKWLKQEEQHVVKFDVVLLFLVNRVLVVLVNNPAEEVDELGVRERVHLFLVAHRIHDGHQRLSEDDAKHFVGQV